MKRALPALIVLLAGCNNDSVNRSIPPIAGVVGGPTTPGGGGSVASEVTDSGSLVAGSTITIRNLQNASTSSAVADGTGFKTISVTGDVGNTLRITVRDVDAGEISHDVPVPSPSIHGVLDSDTQHAGIVYFGRTAQIEGEGFCASATCNTIFVTQGSTTVPFVTSGDARPGVLVFVATSSAGLAPGDATVTVATAGTDGTQDAYTSAAFPVTLTHSP